MTVLDRLYELGQAVWIDYIRRSFLTRGDLQDLMDQGVRGVTSNPTIFEKAIAGSADYDAELQDLTQAGKSAAEIYEVLVMDDIRRCGRLCQSGGQPQPGPRQRGYCSGRKASVRAPRPPQRDDQSSGHTGGNSCGPPACRPGHQCKRHAYFFS